MTPKLSDQKFHKSNLKLVRQILHNNSYPNNIIHKFVRDRYFHCLNKLNNNINLTIQTHNDEISSDPKKIYLKLPYTFTNFIVICLEN